MLRRLVCLCFVLLVAAAVLRVEASPVHREKRFIFYYPPGSNTTLAQNYTLTYVPLGRLLFGGGTIRLG